MARLWRDLTRLVIAATVLAGPSAACSSPPGSTAAPVTSGSSTPSRRTVDAAALDKAVSEFLATSVSPGVENVRAVLIWVDDRLVVQQYHHSTASDSRNIASVTKSVISTLIGVALAEGHLKRLDQTLGELLPAQRRSMAPGVEGITLHQLLTMTAGLPEDDHGDVTFPDEKNWVRGILRQGPDQPPPAQFAYSSLDSHLLAAILEQNTGQPLMAYARAKLFDPLGIDTRAAAQPQITPAGRRIYEAAHFAWAADPQGINAGYSTIKLTPTDMAKLGRLYLAGGVWNGRRVVSADWVHRATSPQVPTHGSGPTDSYGYQWWTTSVQDHPASAALGFGGQLVEVVPDLKLVVAVSSDFADDAIFNDSIYFTMLSLVVVPAIR
jgi:CubicO group peptidase (beta-lactamase class C family)